MKKNLINFYAYLFRKDHRMSFLELLAFAIVTHLYLSVPDDVGGKIFLLFLAYLLASVIGIIVFGLFDKHSRKLTNKQLNNKVSINVSTSNDITQEQVNQIAETLNRLDEILNKGSR